MKVNKSLLAVLSMFLILLVFVSSASAADTNKTDVLSVDESVNLENNLLSVDNNIKSNDTLKVSSDEILTAGDSWYVDDDDGDDDNSGKGPEDAFESLERAIDAANDGDAIYIASGEYTGDKNIKLNIEKNLNFIKYGGGEAIFDADGDSRIWNIKAQSVNITGLTFKNGKSKNGGAIHFNEKALNCNINAIFNENEAEYGGAIYFDGHINGNISGTFTGNKAEYGGAIYFDGHINGNISGTFTGNKAEHEGGAIYIKMDGFYGNINATFTDNKAGSDGGAIYFDGLIDSNITMVGDIYSTFIGNKADYGGAIYMADCVCANISGTFTANEAMKTAGAIYIKMDGFYGNINGTFTGNKAEYGGAIYFDHSIDGNINSTFIGNEADYGGAIYIFISLYGNISGTFNLNKANYEGGAIYMPYLYGNINATFTNNKATNEGGAIYNRGDYLYGNISGTFSDNEANYGGAIYIEVIGFYGNVNGTFTDNVADYGGAIGICTDESITGNLTGTFINNTANDGGAIHINGTVSGNLNGIFINNTANSSGGAIYIGNSGSDLIVIQESIFINNNNTIYVNQGNNVTAVNCWFGNNATNYNIKPTNIGSATINDWLFLNATANPTELDVNETSTITFKLDSYNDTSKNVNPYDASKMNVQLDLYQTLGELNQTTTLIGKEVLYTAKNIGNSSVTGKFETASYTIDLKNTELKDTEIIIKKDTISLNIGENATAEASVEPKDGGTLIYKSNDPNIATVDENGKITAKNNGTTTITVSLNPNPGYKEAQPKNITVTVILPEVVINAENVTKYYKGPERFVVNITDYKGNPLANKTVNITINGITYTRLTDENGTASIPLGLHSGQYNVTTKVGSITANSTVSILTTVEGSDVVKMYKNATQYYATFKDSEGKYLADGTEVKFNINGVEYTRKITGGKGQAGLNINLPQGEYIITAINPVNGEMQANNITVLPTVVDNKDIIKYYRNGTQYSVKVLGSDGKAVGAGENVTFNVNGVFYTRQTNASGIATLTINLPPSNYVITADYKGCRVANNITVLPVLNATDLKMKYKDGSKFKANLVDGEGKPYADETIQFNVNGVLYNKVTDSTGQAALNIRLPPGEYIITSSFNGCNIANKITITG
jgi:predicted outer membrane repeat protein